MRKLLLIGWVGALSVGVAAYPAAVVLEKGAVEAYVIAAKDPSAVSVEKAIFEPPKAPKDSKAYRDAVMSIYGVQTDEPTKVVFVDQAKFVHPEELPTLTLLPVNKEKGENPLQVKTLYFFATRVAIGANVVFVVLLLGFVAASKKGAGSAPPPAPQ